MERQIYVEPLQKRFKVGLKSANKEKRNRSYLNATNCCGVKVKQEKFCSSCNAQVDAKEIQRKIVKVGKQEYLIDAKALDDIQEQLEQVEDVKIHTFLREMPSGAEDRFDSLMYAVPVEKKSAEYREFAELLKGRVAVGTGVFRGNEFQLVVTVGDDEVIRVRKLVEESQRYDFNTEGVQKEVASASVNGQILELEKQILDKKMADGFDITAFRDTRAEMEEKVIEEFVVNGKVPEVKATVTEKVESSEIERLKALMG